MHYRATCETWRVMDVRNSQARFIQQKGSRYYETDLSTALVELEVRTW